MAAQQQAWAEGPPIWKPLRSPSPSSPNSLFPENRRRSYPTTSRGFLWSWRPPPLPILCAPGLHQLPGLGPGRQALPVPCCRLGSHHLLQGLSSQLTSPRKPQERHLCPGDFCSFLWDSLNSVPQSEEGTRSLLATVLPFRPAWRGSTFRNWGAPSFLSYMMGNGGPG